MKLIAQGAESKLYLSDGKIIKNRFRKKYRIKEIDKKNITKDIVDYLIKEVKN